MAMIFCRIDCKGDGVFIGEGITYDTAYTNTKDFADAEYSLDGSEEITFWRAEKVRVKITRTIEFDPID